MFAPLRDLSLLHPGMLLLAVLVPIAVLLRLRRGEPAVRFGAAGLTAGLPGSWRTRLRPAVVVVQALGVLLVVIALARPVAHVPEPRRAEGIDILLCLDMSSSMTARDLEQPGGGAGRTRLDVAKDAAARFVAGRRDDRIGLLCFARYPELRCPPTLDHRALGAFLAAADVVASDGPEDATGIGTAVARAAQALREGAGRSRVAILLTDGEENVAIGRAEGEIAPLHAAQLCERLGVRVYAVAVGAGRRDAAGGWVPLDTTEVERLAARTGGRFFEARDAAAMDGVYAAIDALETTAAEEPRHRVEERFLPFVVAAMGLLLLGRVLDGTGLRVLP